MDTPAFAIEDSRTLREDPTAGTARRARIIYWATTGVIALVMFLGGLSLLFSAQNHEALRHLGFPGWFAAELGVAKLLGVAALVTPRVPARVREWAYAGFAIVLVSASLAHFNGGDPLWRAVDPLGFLVVLIVSNRYAHKLSRSAGRDAPRGLA